MCYKGIKFRQSISPANLGCLYFTRLNFKNYKSTKQFVQYVKFIKNNTSKFLGKYPVSEFNTKTRICHSKIKTIQFFNKTRKDKFENLKYCRI